MPGFGSDPFGTGPFGRYDWSEAVLWGDLSDDDRTMDAIPDPDGGGGRLRKFVDCLKPTFDELLLKVMDWTDLRDAEQVRTEYDGALTLACTVESVDTELGVVWLEVLPVVGPPAQTAVEQMEMMSAGWVFQDAQRRQFAVAFVDKIDGGLLAVEGLVVPDVSSPVTVYAPPLIQFLGADFGVDVDAYEPEEFQRMSVREVASWLDMKGTARAYDVIGKIGGYRVSALQLWGIGSGIAARLLPAHVFTIGGKQFTDVPPTRPIFDQVAADVVPTDKYCWETGVDALIQTAIVVTAQVLVSANRYRLTISGDWGRVSKVGHWFLTQVGLGELWLETKPVDVGGGLATVEILSLTVPPTGGGWVLDYDCPVVPSCEYCPASLIELSVVQAEVLAFPQALMDNAVGRMLSKVQQVVPIHVRTVDASLEVDVDTAPPQPTMELEAGLEADVSMMNGWYYDLVPADDMMTDSDGGTMTDDIEIV